MGFKPRQDSRFNASVYGFLIELAMNNNRDWFAENKEFYISAVKEPLLGFIADVGPKLEAISGHFRADNRSMFRIYRDVRFSKDKRPYKTHAAAHFRHKAGKDVHTPGFYIHIEPGSVFAGAGIWQPNAESLVRIRKRIATNSDEWRAIISAPLFRKNCVLHGTALKRPPRGFDPDHAMIEDLKRKDFVAVIELDDRDVLAADFADRFAKACKVVAPFNQFLCKAVGVPF